MAACACFDCAAMINLPPEYEGTPGTDEPEVVYPEVSDDVYRRLYRVADWMLHAAPWEKMTNMHGLVIVDPESGEHQIAAVMGNGGDLYGFHLYLPDEGTRWFSRLAYAGYTQQTQHEAQFEQRMLELGFDDGLEELIDDHDDGLDEQFAPDRWNEGVGPEKLMFAQFRSYRPGCPPWHPEQHEAERLLAALEVFRHYYLNEFEKHDDLLFAPEPDPETGRLVARVPTCRLRRGGDAGDPAQWEFSMEDYTAPAPKEQPVAPADDVFAGRMARHRVKQGAVWEIGAIFLPRPVLDDGWPHYAVAAFAGVRSNGNVHGLTNALAGDCRFTLMRDCLEKAAGDCGHLPSEIVVGSPVAETALADAAKACGIRITPAHDPSEMALFHEITSALLESDALGGGQPPLQQISEEEALELQKILANAPAPDCTPEEARAFMESIAGNPKMKGIFDQFLANNEGFAELLESGGSPSPGSEQYTMPESRRRYVFRVDLYGAKPPIWRRISLPDDATFFDLHLAIQAAFDWSGYHLHSFEIGERSSFSRTLIDWKGEDDEFMMFGDIKRHELAVRLKDIFGANCKKARYTYDFGDGWEHVIKLEKEIEDSSGEPVKPFEVIKGRGGHPLEDCGGVWGLMEVIDGTHPACGELPADRLHEIQNGIVDLDEIYPRDAEAEMELLDEMNDC